MSKRFPDLVLSGRTGHMITLHRRLQLPCFPASEAGPAAIGALGRSLPREVAEYAQRFQDGAAGAGPGARKGVPQSVVVLSPMVPGLVELADRVDWRTWERGPFPKLEADVIIVWRPCRILRRVRLADAAGHLVNAAFGGGAVYSSVGCLWDMIESHEKLNRRRHVQS